MTGSRYFRLPAYLFNLVPDSSLYRAIRTFVRREGRITPAQQRALAALWPRYGITNQGMINPDKLFGRSAPCTLEIGFGNGETLLHLATSDPDGDYLGIEVHRPGIGRLLMGAERAGLSNVRVACADAVEVLQHRLPGQSMDRILILFPDPWPKKRHHKRRLAQPAFMRLAVDKLKADGRIQLATDWEDYALQMLAVMERNESLSNVAGAGHFAQKPPDLPATRFERRGQRLGHGVWYLDYLRK